MSHVKDLVGVGVPDPGDPRLIPQHTLELGPPGVGEDRPQGCRVERRVQGVRPEPRHHRHLQGVAHDVRGQALLGPRLGHVQAGDRGHGRLRCRQQHSQGQRRAGTPTPAAAAQSRRRLGRVVAPADPTAPRQVQHQEKRLSVRVDRVQDQVLAQPGEPEHLRPSQRGHRRVEGLECADRGHIDADHDHPRGTLGECLRQGGHLGQLGHGSAPPSASAAARRPRAATRGRPSPSEYASTRWFQPHDRHTSTT